MRETKKITTKGKFEVELKTYISGGESREISNVFLEGMKFQMDSTGQAKSNEMSASLGSKAQDKAIELLVVSVNGKKENVLNSVLDMPKSDFDEVLKEIDALQNGLTTEKKTN
jgi:hypothetical protein